jgi:phage portal protein BeeE
MDSINPDLVVIQDVFTRALPPGVYARWETGAFLRSDIKTRYESYAIGLASGFLSVDEVRAKEELGPMEQQPQGVTP